MSVSIIRILNQPGWNCKLSHEGVSILAPTKQDAIYLAQSYGYALSETAAKIKGKVGIGWKRCKQPIEFYGWMASQKPSTPVETAQRLLPAGGTVFCSQLDLPVELLRRMVTAAENERPVSIVRQDNNKQIIINQAMSDMLQTSPEIATQRVMTRFWLPGDLAELERRLSNESRFTWTYCGGLNEQTWAILTTQFEAFEVEGVWYRQGTCLTTPQLVPIPSRAFAPA
ncbi:PAS domain-containing protein [Mastigocladopsis repens]|uniref:PAS domain-containing protein n=1 Tax=Mastigocladopsis repens TaxID=221287 RepID=UPI0002F28DF6|nr:PAS domain-containing protein [Mastigocladopsis repens]